MSKRKAELMRQLYGIDALSRQCVDCSNFISGRYHGRILRKCTRYGMTHSEASDWAKSWLACGMFNVPLPDGNRTVIETKQRKKADFAPIDGQISFEGGMTE